MTFGQKCTNLTGNGGPSLRNVQNRPVTQSSQHAQFEEANMATGGQIDVLQDEITGFNQFKRNFVDYS